MTRKDYEAAARIARDYVLPHRLSVAEAFATLFTQDSPRFDRERFFAACALTPDGRSAYAFRAVA